MYLIQNTTARRKDQIHIYNGHCFTMCGKELMNSKEFHGDEQQITCKNCLKFSGRCVMCGHPVPNGRH